MPPKFSARGNEGLLQGGIKFDGALVGGTILQAIPVGAKFGAVVHGAEEQAEVDLGADVNVGSGEGVAGDELVLADGMGKDVHGGFEGSVAEAAGELGGRHMEAGRFVGDGRFDRACGKEEPAVVGGALGRGRCELVLGECIGQVGANRGDFGDDLGAVHDGRYLAYRVDGQILLGFHRRAEFYRLGLVFGTGFFEHPANDGAPGLWVSVKSELF